MSVGSRPSSVRSPPPQAPPIAFPPPPQWRLFTPEGGGTLVAPPKPPGAPGPGRPPALVFGLPRTVEMQSCPLEPDTEDWLWDEKAEDLAVEAVRLHRLLRA